MLKIIASVLLLVCPATIVGAQISRKGPKELGLSQDPGHKQYLSINGVKFSSPRGFDTRRVKTTEDLIYVPHDKYDLGIFVVAPKKAVDAEYIRGACIIVTSYLFPNEGAAYSWKEVDWGNEKVSKFETGGGMLQGFNALIKSLKLK